MVYSFYASWFGTHGLENRQLHHRMRSFVQEMILREPR